MKAIACLLLYYAPSIPTFYFLVLTYDLRSTYPYSPFDTEYYANTIGATHDTSVCLVVGATMCFLVLYCL